MILPCISNTGQWINIIPGIVDKSYTANDLILFKDYCDLISWSSDFVLYLQPYQVGRHHTLDTCSVWNLILFVGHCDLYIMLQ